MKCIAISDTHCNHREIKLPFDSDIDTFIHCGDITNRGEMLVLEDFSNWMKELPYRNKVCIFGNHSIGTQRGEKREVAIQFIKDAGAHYLENSGVEIDGVKIWGSPATPYFHNWEYNYQRGEEIAKVWSRIDPATNLLITHGPPYGILDEAPRGFGQFEHIGCQDLLNRIDELTKLKVSVFGHLHLDFEPEQPVIRNGVRFFNAAMLDNRYQVAHKPIVFEL